MPENDFTRFRDMIIRGMPPGQPAAAPPAAPPMAPPFSAPGPAFAAPPAAHPWGMGGGFPGIPRPQPPVSFPPPFQPRPPGGFDVLTAKALPRFPILPAPQAALNPSFPPPPAGFPPNPQRFNPQSLNRAGAINDLAYRPGSMNGVDPRSMVALVANKANPTPPPVAKPPNPVVIDWDKTLETLDRRASQNQDATGWCGRYVRKALEAGGFILKGTHEYAHQFGDALQQSGARPVATSDGAAMPKDYTPQAGDIAVFKRGNKHDAGHVQMYDGHGWVSDWHQKGDYSPFREPETTTPSVIYRLPGR